MFKVEKITLSISPLTFDDAILKAAELIKEGYKVYSFDLNPQVYLAAGKSSESIANLVLTLSESDDIGTFQF